MTFSATRVASTAARRRALRNGLSIPTIVGVSVGTADAVTALVVTPPAGSVGDLIFVHMTRDGAVDPAFTQSAGETLNTLWDLEDSRTSASAHGGSWRIRTGSDTTYTFSNVGEWEGFVCYAISGHDPTTPINDFETIVGGTGTTYIVPAAESDITNCLVLQLGGAGGGLAGTLTPPSNDGVDHASHKFGGSAGAIHCAVHDNFAAGGGTGTRTWGIDNTSESRFGAQVIIAPIEGAPSKLEFEATTDNLLFEDSSGVLLLET